MIIAKPIYAAPLLFWIVAHVCGCTSPVTEHDERLEHQVPAHRPATFGDGIRQLRPRLARFAGGDALVSPVDRKREITELIEIAGWLPILAAESPLNKKQWELVKAKSDDLLLAFNSANTQETQGVWQTTTEDVDAIIRSLEALAPAATEEDHLGINEKSSTISSGN